MVAARSTVVRNTARRAEAAANSRDDDMSSSDRVVSHINAAIMDGRYVPGQRLVEANLTHALGVSRGPVREAFRRLDALGILVRTMHRGASVRTFSRKEALDLLIATEPLSALACRLAAERFWAREKGFDVGRYQRELKPYRDRVEDSKNLLGQRQHFYDVVVEISGNTQLPSMMPTMRVHLLRVQIQSFVDAEDRRQHLDDYAEIAKAILQGNSKAAEKALSTHLKHTRQVVTDLPIAAFPRPIDD